MSLSSERKCCAAEADGAAERWRLRYRGERAMPTRNGFTWQPQENREKSLLPLIGPSARCALAWWVAAAAPARSEPVATHAGTATRTRVSDSRVLSLECVVPVLAGRVGPCRRDSPVTRDRARKKAIRARMAATGEPYSVAARELDDTPPASDAVVREVIARVNATLAAPSARIEYRRESDLGPRPARPRPGPVGRLARLAAGAAWRRIAPGVDAGELERRSCTRSARASSSRPPAGTRSISARTRRCTSTASSSAASLEPRCGTTTEPASRATEDDPLLLLGLLREVTQARYSGAETLRGTPCRAVAVLAGSAALTAWLAGPMELTVSIDDEHVRRIQSEWRDPSPRRVGRTEAYELWDFGVPVGSLDWSRLPSFRTPG